MGSGKRLVRPNGSTQPQMIPHWARRDFVKGLTAVAGAAALSAYEISFAAAQQPLETNRLTLINDGTTCIAPMFVAGVLLKSEGFTDVRYLKIEDGTQTQRLAAGDADISLGFASGIVKSLDAGEPLLALAGIHPGCFELFGTDGVRAIHDLHGKTVAVLSRGSAAYLFLSSMAAYVGLDPSKDIRWVEHSHTQSMRLLAEGRWMPF